MQQTTQTEVEAANVRVTPRELAQATAIVEARRDAEARHLADTIALGEAVQQLGLAATPEELLAEVQALRANAPQNNTETQAMSTMVDQKETERQGAWFVGFAVCSLLLVSGLLMLTNNMGSTAYSSAYTPMQPPYAAAVQAQSLLPTPARTTASTSADQVRTLNPGLFQSLDLKEGQSAYCSMEQIKSLARGANPAQIWVSNKAGEHSWQLTRKSGSLCVQCWTTPAQAAKIANGQPAVVNGQPAAVDMFGYSDVDVPIALPLNKFASLSTVMRDGKGMIIQVQVN